MHGKSARRCAVPRRRRRRYLPQCSELTLA
jgi:hypothetical protein